jgi:hypothetical protein
MPDPPGQSQVMRYFLGLSKYDDITLISFERP